MPGSENLAGVSSRAVDELTQKLLNASTQHEQETAGRALDRVLMHGHYVLPWRYLPDHYLIYNRRLRQVKTLYSLRLAEGRVTVVSSADEAFSEQAGVHGTDLGQAGFREFAALADFFVFDVDQDALDDVAHLLHVDGEADDVRPASALFLTELLA